MIWIIGGTINATEIAQLLVIEGLPVLVTVTTAYGKALAQQSGAEVIQAVLSPADMHALIAARDIPLVIDASHPFAAEVSQNAMGVAVEANIDYFRFERHHSPLEGVTSLSGYQEVVDYLSATQGKILLTTGSKHIAKFMPLGASRLVARVLSTSGSVALCEAANLKATQIIAISGRCSKALNLSIMREYDIKYLVTKESGPEGGLQEKIQAAKEAGVEVIVILRPTITYAQVFNEYESLIIRTKKVGFFNDYW